MPMPTLITASDLGAWLGADIAPGDVRASAVLSAVSARVRAETGRTWVDPEAGTLAEVPEDVRAVVMAAAGRVWGNPRGVSSQTMGPFSETLGQAATAGLTFTRDELAVLARYRATGRGLYTMATYRDAPQGDGTVYVLTAPFPSGYPFPFLSEDDD